VRRRICGVGGRSRRKGVVNSVIVVSLVPGGQCSEPRKPGTARHAAITGKQRGACLARAPLAGSNLFLPPTGGACAYGGPVYPS